MTPVGVASVPSQESLSKLIDTYSTIGVGLAAVAFSGIVVYISGGRQLGGEEHPFLKRSEIVESLLYNMGSLIVCTFVIANFYNRDLLDFWVRDFLILGTLCLGLSILSLFYSASMVLLRQHDVQDVGRSARALVVGAGPALVLSFFIPNLTYQYSADADRYMLNIGDQITRDPLIPAAYASWLPWLGLAVVTFFSLIKITIRMAFGAKNHNEGHRRPVAMARPSKIVFWVSIIAMVGIQVLLGWADFPECSPQACNRHGRELSAYALILFGLLFTYVSVRSFRVGIRHNPKN
ncbi:hypothetical protein [Actinoplanes derwentensis]|uniref:Uncharacterized protein n=1 Tax=Actinoplanes derwentensis TaxID=113562 RepID=A0A1H2D867_9ACTN|nr:hypothetical protein [Actinoplanes derwentensis]SDT78921.1 hypothetical protein SAMN04489716_8571 [Actinoplanes derwentensis]